ncbi:MAG: type IV secretion system DNA-binding domain-containing protein [Oscillospiraceae bacterium]|nr:type IV secretion system DNA-binding domain-containing protein [Oscillospiraceae bacterium]
MLQSSDEANFIPDGLRLLVGRDFSTAEDVYVPEKSLYQNILITGTIGSGKTSSAMYPFIKQLIEYSEDGFLGMLVLDVKGNFYNQVSVYAKETGRLSDLIVVGLDSGVRYNPLDKPHLKPIVLANRLKTILTLFTGNTGEAYWLDKAEQILCECIKLCRLYNNGYVTFLELHKLISTEGYYKEKILILKELFQSGELSNEDVYNLHSAVAFFEEEFLNLDSRTMSILKSEITRITNTFISDYNVLTTFCPNKEEITFNGFSDVVNGSKIVVLNMNIAEYKNLAKIIAAYLKLDFQSEVLHQLSKTSSPKSSAFICDEFHEYVTSTDSDFFAQSRESKCINIVATQSYTSLLNTLKDNATVKVIVQNLINKFWFRTDDSFTIEDVQKQIGKEDKSKISKSISENANETNYNYFASSLASRNSSVSESISTYVHTDFVYDSHFFTQELEVFSSLAFLSDGYKILKPTKLKMLPHFEDDEVVVSPSQRARDRII